MTKWLFDGFCQDCFAVGHIDSSGFDHSQDILLFDCDGETLFSVGYSESLHISAMRLLPDLAVRSICVLYEIFLRRVVPCQMYFMIAFLGAEVNIVLTLHNLTTRAKYL